MKNKSSRHKSENTFKFIPFAERINKIDVDVFHKVGHEYEDQEEEDHCHFHQTINKWNNLNLTENYDQFKRDIHVYNVVTLPQLIFNKENIKNVLVKHLNSKNELALQPLLDLVVALAKDLRQDFYPFYHEFFNLLIHLLQTKNSEQLEWTFHCLAYLFKYLWRPITGDIGVVFKTLLPLLSEEYHGYINNFAAESFAFVARKVKDFKSFLLLVLKSVKHHKDGINGCGRLLYEVVKGHTGQFHSCANNVLLITFDALHDDKVIQEDLFAVLEKLIAHITENITPDRGELLFTTLLTILDKQVMKWSKLRASNEANTINLLLTLLGQAVEYKSGRFLQKSTSVVSKCIRELLQVYLPTNIVLTTVKITIILLQARCINLTQAEASILVQRILSWKDKHVLLYFVENTFDYPLFRSAILPKFLNYCVETTLDDECLALLTKMLLNKAPLCFDDAEFGSWQHYKIEFGAKSEEIRKILIRYIENNVHIDEMERYVSALIVLPHLVVKEGEEEATGQIRENIVKLCEKIVNIYEEISENEDDILVKHLFALIATIESYIHCSVERDESTSDLAIKDVLLETLLPLSTKPRYIWALKSLDLYFTYAQSKRLVLDKQTLLKCHDTLKCNFNSPYHKLRLYTSHLYSLFELIIAIDDTWAIFSLCYHVESTTPQVDTYRDQLQILERFNFEKHQMQLANNTEFADLPLRYLCGVLYMNFKLLWEPVVNVIASLANGMDIDTFWKVYVEELRTAAQNVRQPPSLTYNILPCVDKFDFLGDLYQKTCLIEDKPDYLNYRIMLWKSMTNFAHIAEARNRDIVDLFLSFINDEYMRTNSDVAFVMNIRQATEEVFDATIDDAEEDEETAETTETDMIKSELTKPAVRSGAKAVLKLLLQHLIVFGKVRSPRSMYKESELYKIYFEFLAHKNWEVQKHVLDCLLTYKNKNVTPYASNLYNIIDDKLLKHELVHFKLDAASAQVQPQHRQDLIPLVLKIVHSKMLAKARKGTGLQRRNMIFRFLSGCEENEMLLFIKMAFKFYDNLPGLSLEQENDDPTKLIALISESIDLENFIPPKRLQSTVNLLQVVFEQFGNLMNHKILHFVLRILLCIGATLKGAFLKRQHIHSGYLSILRSLRTSSIMLVEQFFSRFEYQWDVEQVNAVFEAFVWPYIVKLDTEGMHSPTTLLKLIAFWASHPRFYPMLVKHKENVPECYPLNNVIKLLMNRKVHVSVNNFIMEMIENMLKLTMDDGEQHVLVDNVVPIETSTLARLNVPENNLNYGSCLLLPHVPQILVKMKEKLLKKKRNISKRDLVILSRISELVWEAEISDSTLELLIPIVVKKTKLGTKEEDLLQLLTTIRNLLLNVESPLNHVKRLSPLFACVKEITCRKVLCDIVTDISTHSTDFLLVNELMVELNSFNSRWIDQPDYDRRLAAFRRIETLFKEGNLSLELSILLIYNCFYMMTVEKDLSIRESATDCLKTITPTVVMKYPSQLAYILDETLFPLIKNGFKGSLRNDCIALLGQLARECPDAHVILKNLNKLTSIADLEVDFFENLVHLQMHRHARALLKVKEVFSKEETAPNIRTLTQYILPLATYYLCNDEFVGKHSLIDSACEVIGTVARLMPWHHYEALLKNYLGKLMHDVGHQKQLVKIVVHILDAYHFDLTKGLELAETNEELEDAAEMIPAQEAVDEKKKHEDDEDSVSESDDEDAEDPIYEEDVSEVDAKVKPYEKTTILCKSASKRIIRIIKTILLPQLNRALAMKTTYESTHKLNYKRSTREEREDEDLVRIPITLAVVKLLQRLPKAILDRNLPGVIMKLCTFLKTKLESVRRTARETLQKIVLTLGPDYLGVILGEMSGLQYKGFQMHVLLFTIHAILNSLRPHYEPGHIDNVLLTVVDLCMHDLFGALADEREVSKITRKTSEASSPKSYDTLQILATFITEKCIMDLLLPIKRILGSTNSLKVVNKIGECLKQVALGLVVNKFLSLDAVLKFAYGTASQSIPDLLYKEKPQLTEEQSEKLARQRVDCLIIPKQPVGRAGIRICKVKSSQKANSHLLVEFGLKLCHLLLKRDKFKDATEDYKGFIDPFVGILKNCITTPHIKLNTISLQCMEWLLKYELPSLKDNITDITKSLFALLHKYASAGLHKGDNFDLVVAAFKTMSVLVRDVKYHVIETDQLKVLLMYVEQDLYNYERQATAFGLLKAIIARKLIVPEMSEIIMKVGELSITSELPHVRQQCRIVYHHYVMDYPLGGKLEKYVSFYLAQLNYALQTGRESALEMLQIFINCFPIYVIKSFAGTFLVSIGTRLVNDDVPHCRKMASKCITALLERLEKPDRDPLFEMLLTWFKDKKILHRMLAAQLCGLLINVEKDQFESRIETLIPVIFKQFNKEMENDDAPGKFVRLQKEEPVGFIKERNRDHHLYQVLQMLLKLSSQCRSFLKRTADIENISVRVQTLLSYPHDWVRLGAAQFLGYVLSSIDVDTLSKLLVKREQLDAGYLLTDPNGSLKSLTLDLCAQLQPESTKSDLAEQVIKNLILIARVIQSVPINKKQNQEDDRNQNEDDSTQRVNLLWLIKRVRRIINMEIVGNTNSTTLRIELFKLIAALLTVIDINTLRPILHHLLAPLVREMVTKEKSTEELINLSNEVSSIMKSKIGKDEYTKLLSITESQLTIRRAERKRQHTQLAVTDPELFAKKKVKHHERKKVHKKMKISRHKGLIPSKGFKKSKKTVVVDI